jgi:hypothetical protein
MKRLAVLAVFACLCGCALPGTGRAGYIYDLYSGGATGTLEVEFQVQSLIVTGFSVSPFTPTILPSGVDSTGHLFASSAFSDVIEYDGNDGFSIVQITISGPTRPGGPGTYGLFGSRVANSSGTDIANPDTLVVSQTAATPEPASLTLLGIGAAGLVGYGCRRKRAAAAA